MEKESKRLSIKYKNKPFPYVKIEEEKIIKDIEKLENFNYNNFIIKNENYSFANGFDYPGNCIFIIKNIITGNIISNYFFQKERMKTRVSNHPSPEELWKNDDKRTLLFKYMFRLNNNKLEYNEPQLRCAFRLYYSVACQFKPSVAKIVYEFLGSKKVLDFSSGWGDRLTGFLSCSHTENYIGIDPNTNLKQSYSDLIDFYKKYSSYKNKKIKMIYKPAENVILKDIFDLIFTSPPYFDLEIYSDDKNQSVNKYKNLNEWLESFLFTVLSNNLKLLNKKGYLALHLSNYKKGKQCIYLVEPLLDYMKKQKGFSYKGYIGIKIKGRYNKDFIEPIFIWKKD